MELSIFKWLQAIILVTIGICVVSVDIWQRKRTGKGAFRVPNSKNIKVFLNDLIFWLSVCSWVALGIWWIFAAESQPRFLPLNENYYLPAQIVGVIAGIFGLVSVVSGLQALRLHFRTSIDYGEKTTLITSGIYKYCRNPMALGLLLQGWTTALFMQTWPSFVTAVLLHTTNRMRVYFEEQQLLAILGDQFRTFCKNVGRFLPKLRKLH